jgi:glycosyltransferase involved in cell wall biosynthesis
MVFISILTPVFNGVEFLEQCIRSVRSQTFPDWELWIGVNGHGNDGGMVAQVASYFATSDSRIHVVIQGPPLKGKVESLNHLVSLTTTDWIAVLDCDDLWESRKLEKQVQAIHSYASDAAVIGTFCQYFGERHGNLILESGYIDPIVLEYHNPIINSSSLIRREYCTWEYEENHDGIFEDFYLWMNICLSGKKMYNIPEFLVWHRIHKSSAFNSQGRTDDTLRRWYKNKRIIASNTSY